MYEDENIDSITFTSTSRSGGTHSYVSRTLEDAETYSGIVQEFVYFLNAIGYNYIGGLAVLDQDGTTIHITDI